MWTTPPIDGPMWSVNLLGTDVSTESWLESSNRRFRQVYPVGVPTDLSAEPDAQLALTGYMLSQLTHVTVVTARVGGSGTWTVGIQFFRFNTNDKWPVDTDPDPNIPLSEITVPLTSASSTPSMTFYRNPFPSDFMRASPADADPGDLFVGRAWIRPGSGTASVVACSIYLTTGTQVATRPGFGNLVSKLGQ